MPRQPAAIDRDKLHAAVRKLGRECVFYMLDDAIDLLPPAKLHQIAKKYLDIKGLRPDSQIKTKANLLAAVKTFDKVSRAGEYYESFMVNSKEPTVCGRWSSRKSLGWDRAKSRTADPSLRCA